MEIKPTPLDPIREKAMRDAEAILARHFRGFLISAAVPVQGKLGVRVIAKGDKTMPIPDIVLVTVEYVIHLAQTDSRENL